MGVVPERCCRPRAHSIMGPSARCTAATVSLPSSAALYDGRDLVGRQRNVGVRTCAVWPLPWNSSLTRRHSPAQPPPLQSSRAAATAAWQAPRQAPCSRRQRRLLVHAARARASRRRAPRAAAHERPGLSAWRLVRGLDSKIAQYSTLRGYSTHTHRCSACAARLGGVGGSAPVHAQRRRTPAQQIAKRPSPRDDARAA